MGSITDMELFPKMSLNPWSFWQQGESQGETDLGVSRSANMAESFEQEDK